jgi:flagellar protein FliO/FliZ
MTQSFILVIFFVGLLACLPWAINRLKKQYGLTHLGPTQQSRVLSVLAVGPHQKVVTVEVGPDSARVALVLGVTQQSISLLHTLPAQAGASALTPGGSGPASGLVET